MSTLILRIAGAVVALVGLAGVVIGGWFLGSLGTSGTATFTDAPDARVVVLEPDVLNRIDSSVEIAAEGSATVWAGTARPSDVENLLSEATRTVVTGVDVSEWVLTTSPSGTDEISDVRGLDIWQSTSSEDGSLSVTIDQEEAPQTLVIAAPEGESITDLEFQVTDDRWSTIAIGVLLAGVLLIIIGLALGLAPVLLARSRGGAATREYRVRRGRPRSTAGSTSEKDLA